MSTPGDRHRLNGLEPDNLLAFLALLGTLRCLETTRSGWHPRVVWYPEESPLRPTLILSEPQTSTAICEAVAEGAALLAEDYFFPRSSDDNTSGQKDLNYEQGVARALLKRAASDQSSRRADLWSALMSDAAQKDGKIHATPLCLLFGQGHQHFLDRLANVPRIEGPPARGRGKEAGAVTAVDAVREALFEPWNRADPTPSFRWDPAEDVRYALRANDPSGDKPTTQHGANRLAALGLATLTVAPEQRGKRVRLQVLGGAWERNEFAFSWPIWTSPASLAGIRALLGHPKLALGATELAHLGVIDVRRSRRISVGKFMNFTQATSIRAKVDTEIVTPPSGILRRPGRPS